MRVIRRLFRLRDRTSEAEKLNKRDSEKKASTFSQINDALEVTRPSRKRSSFLPSKGQIGASVNTKCARGTRSKQTRPLLAEIASITTTDATYDIKMKVLKE